MTPDLVCLGNLIVDDVVFADGRTRMSQPGGAMLYAALGAALWGARVAIIAPVGDDYPRDTLRALEARGVDLSGLRPLGRQGLRTWLLYERAARRVVHQLGSPAHAEASPLPADIRGEAAGARAFHIAPIPIECQARLLEPLSLRAGAMLSLDPHDPLREGTLERWQPLLPLLDLLFVSEEELTLPGLEADPAKLASLAGGRLRAIAHKRGERGGVYFDASSGRATPWPARVEAVVDPTGAGDAFAGGFLSGRLAGLGLGGSLARGVVSASFALEDWGAAGLLAATAAEAHRRYDAWRSTFVE